MYEYRNLTPEQQQATVAMRQDRGYPWHSPPHLRAPAGYRLVTGACFEHRKLLTTDKRLAWFEAQLLEAIHELDATCAGWCVLPNHYHVLLTVTNVTRLAHILGQLHGRTSYTMNQEDGTAGRKVWYRCHDRVMRSERHLCASLNYIHHNPVKHGYVAKWQDWPYSSALWYLECKGRDWLVDLWRAYPLLNYGDRWDSF